MCIFAALLQKECFMNTYYLKKIGALLLVASFIWSCRKEKEIEIPIEYELITTLILTLTPESGADTLVRVFTFTDPDGDGGIPPTVVNDTLIANTVYRADILLLDESGDEVVDVTPEIRMTDDAHQFFFQTEANISFTYLDFDGNGSPLGLRTRATTGEASQGPLTITLLHFPNKNAPGVAQGNIENAGGSTDIRVEFQLSIVNY